MQVIINSPNINLNTQQQGAFGTQLGNPEGLSRQIVVEPSISEFNLSSVDSIITIPVTGISVTSIVVNNKVYKLSESVDIDQLGENEFIYNPYTEQVIINVVN